ncbi:MAG: putative sugar O-methyltransferase [Candidatus Competibacteraceae bacterium]
MNTRQLSNLLEAYKEAPQKFQVTDFWKFLEQDILNLIPSIDVTQLRSGKYPELALFGFNDVIYPYYAYNSRPLKKAILKLFHRYLIKDRPILPYQMTVSAIQEMAYHHCELMAALNKAKPIDTIEMSTFGNPADRFEIGGRKYSIHFFRYYLRYCFAHKYISFNGNEIIVELGSGSGYQVEVLKKLYPDLTVLCFDLPTQIFLGETYLSGALGEENVIGTDITLNWKDLSSLKKGLVYCFGNWQFPLLRNLQFDIFWNAASFGEMEPEIVENYLDYIKGEAQWIYLLQVRRGKETGRGPRVRKAISFDDYNRFLDGYILQEQRDAFDAHKKIDELGGYFEAIWKRSLMQ